MGIALAGQLWQKFFVIATNLPPIAPVPAKIGWGDRAYILLLPLVGWLAFDINPWNQKDYVDPWFYTGAGQAFTTLVARYGWPYYYIRFPVVFLNSVFCGGNHPALGYLLLRYVLLVAICGTIYGMALRRYSRRTALVASLFVLCEPVLLRNIMWDYPPFVSLSAALVGIMMWEYEGDGSWVRKYCAGGLFCVAANSNVFIVTLLGCYGLAAIGYQIFTKQFRRTCIDLGVGGLGFLTILCLGIAYLKGRVPAFQPLSLWTVTVEAVRSGNTYAKTHSVPFATWGATLTHIYTPFAMTVAALILSWKNVRNARELVLPVTGGLYCIFFLIYAQISGTFVFDTFYYFAHLAMVSHLVVPHVLGTIERRANLPSVPTVMAAMVLLVFIFIAVTVNRNAFTGNLVPSTWTWIWGAEATVVVAAIGCRTMRNSVCLGLASLVLFGAVCLMDFNHPTGRFVYNNPWQKAEKECYDIGVQYARLWQKHAQVDGNPFAWFNRSDRAPDLFALTFVSLGVSLSEKWGDPQGMPNIGDYEMARLRENRNVRIIMLATDLARIAAGKRALESRGLNVKTLEVKHLESGSFKLEVEVISFEFQTK